MTKYRSAVLRSVTLAFRSLGLVAACSLASVASAACAASDGDKAPDATPAAAVLSGEDIVNIDDILIEDTGAGATKLGDPAAWLEAARLEIKQANGYARAALGRVADFAKENAPTRQGKLPSGDPFALWQGEKDGTTYRLLVARTGETRVRYYMEGVKGAQRKPLLTGVFLKHAPKRGAGRIHINLTNLNELTGAPDATGNLQVWFANSGDARARRFRYREVRPKNLGADGAINYGLDAVHKPGKGGVMRTYAIGDLGTRVPDLAGLGGVQLAALRARWTPDGGRADVGVFDLKPGGTTKLGDAHECWEGGGLRKAYRSFTKIEDDGDTAKKVDCGGFDEEAPPADAAPEGITDPEADSELVEALTISEDDASATIDVAD
jgi:hypothetical protein